jgi:Zn-dependent protease
MRTTPIMQLFNYFSNPTSENGISLVIMLFSLTAVVAVLLPFHECAHALTAWRFGDNTANEQGRLTLNPLKHIDPIGLGCMFLVGFGWAKPVPINPLRASRKISMRAFIAITAAAGPVSNILFSLICIIIAKIIYVTTTPVMLIEVLSELDMYGRFWNLSFNFTEFLDNPFMAYLGFALIMMATISVFLAVFNLIPIPPLDGSKMLFFFLNNRQVYMIERHMHIIRTVLLVLLLTGFLSPIIGSLGRYVMIGLNYATFFITL